MQIPYHRPFIGEEEIEEVIATLRSGWLTSGKRVEEFENLFAKYKEAESALAVNSCTSGLFLILKALGIKEGDEVITTPFTFVATANVILHVGAKPVFADIDPQTLNIDPFEIEQKITARTKAILPVHIGGNPCKMDAILDIADRYGLKVVEDCAHSIESKYDGIPIGKLGNAGAFSLYATKNITAAEGGMVLARDSEVFEFIRSARLHGLNKNAWERESPQEYIHYDVTYPGYKCNLTDLQAAIGMHQMARIDSFYKKRETIVKHYNAVFEHLDGVETLISYPKAFSALHLYILKLIPHRLKVSRDEIIHQIQLRGIQLSVNYTPLHLFTWFQKNLQTAAGQFPHAEQCGANVLSLPIYPKMTEEEMKYVVDQVTEVIQQNLIE